MKAEDIIKQLQGVLPFLTNLFSDEIAISRIWQENSTAYCSTVEPHGLINNEYVNISGVRTKNKIVSLTREGKNATAILSYPHDVTLIYQPTVNISGCDQVQYNGEKILVDVPGIKKIKFQVSGNPPTPATGDIYLNELRYSGFNGWHEITVIDDYNFSYPLRDTLPYLVPTGEIKCRFNIRTSGAATLEEAETSYTQKTQNGQTEKYWAFVVLDDVDISKDRNIETDSTTVITPGDRFRQRQINRFDVYVFSPCTSNISGRVNRDSMEDVALYLYAAILRYKFPTGLASPIWSQTTANGHSIVSKGSAYYIHRFKFEAVSDITTPDTIVPDANVALREIDFSFLNQATENDYIEMSAIAKMNDNSKV